MEEMATAALEGTEKDWGKKCKEACRVRETVVRSERLIEDKTEKTPEKPIKATPATVIAVYACGVIPFCLGIHFWKSFLWSAILLCPPSPRHQLP